MSFTEQPTVDQVLEVLTFVPWTFEWKNGRGILLDGRIYYDAWERTVGERPEIAYPGSD